MAASAQTTGTVKLTLYCKRCKIAMAELDVPLANVNKVKYRYRGATIECPSCACNRAPQMEWGKGDTSSSARGAQDAPGAGKPADANEGRAATTQEAGVDYGTLTKAELIAHCEEEGISTSGTKAELIARLSGE
jgi:hypothetical protein